MSQMVVTLRVLSMSAYLSVAKVLLDDGYVSAHPYATPGEYVMLWLVKFLSYVHTIAVVGLMLFIECYLFFFSFNN